jgi:diaminopimelate decarboxylase
MPVNNKRPQVKPVIHPDVENFIDKEKKNIDLLLNKHGSPVHLIFPHIIEENVNRLNNYFFAKKISGKIFYAHKANTSFAILQRVKNCNIGIEVSSYHELKNAIKAGFIREKIICNGPKNSEYLNLIKKIKPITAVDNLAELYATAKTSLTDKIFIRFSNFFDESVNIRAVKSRFGIAYYNKKKVIDILQSYQKFNFIGLSFHIDSTSVLEKQIAIKKLIEFVIDLKKSGIAVEAVNIGGGLKINYVNSKDDWENFIQYLQTAVLTNSDYLWNNHSFGYYVVNGRIRGDGSFYPYFNSQTLEQQLNDLLEFYIEEYKTSARQLVNDLMLDLYIEPGRMILDQTGITIAKIIEVIDEENFYKIIADINYKNITADQDIMVDPLLVAKKNKKQLTNCFIFGNLCLENDIIFKRQIFFDYLPQKDDFLIFVNTAAYKMDFSDGFFIHHRLPQKIIIEKKLDGYDFTTEKL